MKTMRIILALSVAMCLVAGLGFVLARSISLPAFAQNSTNPNANVPPFDFNNNFYTENGIDPIPLAGPGGRVGVDSTDTPCTQTTAPNPACNGGGFGFPNAPGQMNWVTDTTTTDPTRTSTRLLQTTGGFNKDGNLIYYQIMGTANDDSFFSDSNCPTDFAGCGTRANMLANEFRAFISPKQLYSGSLVFPSSSCATVDTGTGVGPVLVDSTCAANSAPLKFAPPPPNRRQDNVFDTQNTYFCQNLLGLWILTFAVYTPQAYLPNGQYASAAAQAAIAPIAAANGITLDGTAILKRVSDIDGLTAQGFVQQLVMPRTTHKGAPRYVV